MQVMLLLMLRPFCEERSQSFFHPALSLQGSTSGRSPATPAREMLQKQKITCQPSALQKLLTLQLQFR